GRFCKEFFPSQKALLDKACERVGEVLEKGAPVVVFGDPGSWLLIFYIRFFFYFSKLNKKFQIHLDPETLNIMEILRYRHEDITEILSQRILRYHDPFASIMRQDLVQLELNQKNVKDSLIILFNYKRYSRQYLEDFQYLSQIFENPDALLIFTGAFRNNLLKLLWEKKAYYNPSFKRIHCKMFNGNMKHQFTGFCLHFDENQVVQVLRQIIPKQVYLFHQTREYFKPFIERFLSRYKRYYPNTEIFGLEPEARFILYHPFMDIQTEKRIPSELYHFIPLIDILETFLQKGFKEVSSSHLSKQLLQKYPYWKEQTGFQKNSDYLIAAETAGFIKLDRSKSDLFVQLVYT
ncbi:MAG: hypothetical protein ACTSQQ_09150, partial [Candidatus Helarchaeota archaeon]